MKRKPYLFPLCVIMVMVLSCAPTHKMMAPQPVIVSEGGKTIAQVCGAQFAVPPKFRVVGSEADVRAFKTYTVTKAVLQKREKGIVTMIVISGHKADKGRAFIKANMNRKFPDAFFYDQDTGYISQAATYLAAMPMARKLYLEYPLCKVLSGFSYNGKRIRYRIDIYENLTDDPQILCCERKKKKKEKLKEIEAMKALKKDLEQFRADAMALIKNHVRWPSGTN
jgi:hypothetical protein